MKIVIFDFCDTLVKGQTANKFVYFVLSNIKRSYFQNFCFYILSKVPVDFLNIKKKVLLYSLKGINKKSLDNFAKSYSKNLIYNKKVLSIFKRSIDSGEKVIIASGGYATYISKFVNNKKVKVIANEFKFKNNIFTGFLKNKDCLGTNKSNRIKSLNLDLSNSYFYSDSMTDTPTFKIVKNPYFFSKNKITKLKL